MKNSKMFQLYELRDNLEEAIENLKKFISQQEELIEIISNSKIEEFTDFLKALNESTQSARFNLNKYENRLSLLKELLSIFEKKDDESEKLDKYVTNLLEILNLAVEQNEIKEEKDTINA